MSASPPRSTGAELAAAFDHSFAAPLAATGAAQLDLLLVRVAGVAYAIRSRDVMALHVDLRIVPMPTRARSFLGLTTLRNVLVPIHELGVLLGGPRSAIAPRWCVIGSSEPAIGYAFEAFEGHARIEARDAHAEVVHVAGVQRALLDPGGLVAITDRSGRDAAKEA